MDPLETNTPGGSDSKKEAAPSAGFGFFSSFATSFTTPAAAPAKEQEPSSFWGFIKEKTVVITDVIRHDVNEFAKTITDDTKEAIRGRANPLAEGDDEAQDVANSLSSSTPSASETSSSKTPKDSISGVSILPAPSLAALSGHVKASIAWLGDMLDENSTFTKFPGEQMPEIQILNRVDAQILAIQKDTQTYTAQPTPENTYTLWLKAFDLNTKTEEIAQLLGTNDELRSIHHKLVPKTVNYNDFWTRYFFKIHKFHEEEARRQALLKKTVEGSNVDDELGWDIGDDETEEHTIVTKEINQNTSDGQSKEKDIEPSEECKDPQGKHPAGQEPEQARPNQSDLPSGNAHKESLEEESAYSSSSSDVVVVDLRASLTACSLQNIPAEPAEQDYEIVMAPPKEIRVAAPAEAGKKPAEEEGWDDWE